MNDKAIVTNGLKKCYGLTTAVDNLHLTVEYGEIFGFLGPNGAGKSTTIKMLVGLLRPTAGSAIIAGYDVSKESLPLKKSIGYLAERPYIYEQLTGQEFLRFCGGLYRLDDSETARRSEVLLEILDMTSKSKDLIESYSHGMRQKIALAASLLHQPKVLFLDEPTNGLDPQSARRVKDLLRERATAGAAAVFLSTHILEIAEQLCDRVGIIYQGRLIAVGTLADIRKQAHSNARTLEDAFLALTHDAKADSLRP
jgi:ABC-2 type transport system ATP-binding protein